MRILIFKDGSRGLLRGAAVWGGVRVRLTTPGIADIVFLLDSAASDLKPWATLNCIF